MQQIDELRYEKIKKLGAPIAPQIETKRTHELAAGSSDKGDAAINEEDD